MKLLIISETEYLSILYIIPTGALYNIHTNNSFIYGQRSYELQQASATNICNNREGTRSCDNHLQSDSAAIGNERPKGWNSCVRT